MITGPFFVLIIIPQPSDEKEYHGQRSFERKSEKAQREEFKAKPKSTINVLHLLHDNQKVIDYNALLAI